MSELKTIDSHVSFLRKMIKQYSDDSSYDDEFLYKVFIDSRNVILGRKIEEGKYNNPFNEQKLYVPLKVEEYEQCLPNGTICKVNKSLFKIPSYFTTKYGPAFKVMTFGGRNISGGNLQDFYNLQFTKTRKEDALYEIKDDYLVIFNNNNLKAILIVGTAEDPLEFAQFPRCNADGTYTDKTCFDPHTQVIPLDSKLNDAVYELCLNKLGFTMKVKEDIANDSISE